VRPATVEGLFPQLDEFEAYVRSAEARALMEAGAEIVYDDEDERGGGIVAYLHAGEVVFQAFVGPTLASDPVIVEPGEVRENFDPEDDEFSAAVERAKGIAVRDGLRVRFDILENEDGTFSVAVGVTDEAANAE
jgi:hypothetical protein